MNGPWLAAQVRHRAAELFGPDYRTRTNVARVVDGLQADHITDTRHIPAADLDQRIACETLQPADTAPVFTRTGIPGINRIDVYPGGRIRLDGDLDLNRHELATLVEALATAGVAARDHDPRPIRRPHGVNEQLANLADHNG